MNLFQQQPIARRFIQTVLLAMLLNLSGHVFLHLGDAVATSEETHFSSPHETKTATAPQHQCSVCQDHQHLSLESSDVASLNDEAEIIHPLRQHDFLESFLPEFAKPSRAPPRS